MITRPSTPQILLDVCEELRRDVLPGITDPAAQIRMHMLMGVLANCANAAAHEIAHMTDETAAYRAYAHDVAAATGLAGLPSDMPSPPAGDPPQAAAPRPSLHLDDVAAEYSRAGDAFATALEAAMDAGHRELIARGEDLLRQRRDTEQSILSGMASAGRSAS